MDKVEIIDIVESSTLSPRGEVQRTRRVTFKVGKFGPFTKDIPEEEFSKEKVDQAIQEEVRELQRIQEAYS